MSQIERGGPIAHHDLLMQAFGFSLADLEANRHGRLSPTQRHQLEWLQFTHALRFFIGLMIGVIIIIITLIAARTPILLLVGIAGALFSWGWCGSQALRERRINRDLQNGARRLTGIPQIKPDDKRDDVVWLVIGNWSCPVRAKAVAIFKPNEQYTIYCAYHAHILLSIERLS